MLSDQFSHINNILIFYLNMKFIVFEYLAYESFINWDRIILGIYFLGIFLTCVFYFTYDLEIKSWFDCQLKTATPISDALFSIKAAIIIFWSSFNFSPSKS